MKELIIEDKKATGVVLETGEQIRTKAVILTTGTYLKGAILVGRTKKAAGGPHGEKASNYLKSIS